MSACIHGVNADGPCKVCPTLCVVSWCRETKLEGSPYCDRHRVPLTSVDHASGPDCKAELSGYRDAQGDLHITAVSIVAKPAGEGPTPTDLRTIRTKDLPRRPHNPQVDPYIVTRGEALLTSRYTAEPDGHFWRGRAMVNIGARQYQAEATARAPERAIALALEKVARAIFNGYEPVYPEAT